MSRAEYTALGWDALDILLISGDAYVDHPSFGIVLLARWLIENGFRTGLLCQPPWDRPDALIAIGRPLLCVGIGAGSVDSLLAHYTAFRKKRGEDAFSPGGRMGLRPNRATIVYANLARRAYPGLPLVLGGIEASTRRVTHYDFWSDSLRRPILFDAKADLLVYGMGERAMVTIAKRLQDGEKVHEIVGVPGTAWISPLSATLGPLRVPAEYDQSAAFVFPAHEACLADPKAFMALSLALEAQVHAQTRWAYQECSGRALVLAKPAQKLSTEEMDAVYGLPFTRKAHPSYREKIPAASMLATSITSHRGCGGGCSFCSLAMHQGRMISSRSEGSLLSEARELARKKPASRRSTGLAISDVGGPTANMWGAICRLREKKPGQACKRESCCYPDLCPNFSFSQKAHVDLLTHIASLPGVASVRVASGIRPDLALTDAHALAVYVREFTGGQLKLAPEHAVHHVLCAMRKPDLSLFERFLSVFMRESRKAGKEQYIVPYLMSAFPGCTDEDMRVLAAWLAKRNWSPKQTQCFIPTPGTIATAMFYCGTDTAGRPMYVARSDAARLRQHAILTRPR
ncbi:MAG: YgiQ family radical SAM protein [Desulfovibrionaceae bacterium]|nr:YgiQ family radical SAM protein [Desulfovibrionaceae bacterium]